MTDIAKLKAAALAATPGSWTHDGCGGVCADVGLNGCYFVAECEGDDWGSNSEFIALANPAAVLELIAALEAKDAQIAELEARTVKLPPKVDSSNVPFAAHTWNSCIDEVSKRLSSVGINLETGGE